MLLLNVPYEEKDEAKKLGAKWNPNLKRWYVQNDIDYYKFIKWIYKEGDAVVCNNLYVIEGKKRCFKCGHETKVISFATDDYWLFDDMEALLGESVNLEEISKVESKTIEENCHIAGDLNLVGMIENIPDHLLDYLKTKYNIKQRYSKTTQTTAMSNCCDNCDVLQGSFFLYEEVDSPFWIESKSDVDELKFYKIPLKSDLIIDSGLVRWSSSDCLMKQYGRFEILDILDK